MKRTTPPAARPSSRTQRKRKVAERVRTVDASVLREVKARHLDSLENDNYAAENEEAVLADEPEYDPDADSDDALGVGIAKRKKRVRSGRLSSAGKGKVREGIEKWNKPLKDALEEEALSERPKGMVRYDDIAAKPSLKPARPFCSVCGYQAAYTCTRCYVRFCSVRCGNVHKATRCLKDTS